MTRQEFKEKYIENAFFWIDSPEQAETIQYILIEFGFKCHTGSGTIQYHEGFKRLATFPKDRWHDFEYFQQVDVWLPNARYGEPVDYVQFIEDFKQVIQEAE